MPFQNMLFSLGSQFNFTIKVRTIHNNNVNNLKILVPTTGLPELTDWLKSANSGNPVIRSLIRVVPRTGLPELTDEDC